MSELNKKMRLEKLIKILKTQNTLTNEEISSELGVSYTTASRDIKALKQKGYKITCKDGSYSITGDPPQDLVESNFSLVQFRLIHLIKTISSGKDHKISKGSLIKEYVKEGKELEDPRLKITRKTLMKNLQILLDKSIIRKEEYPEEGIFYQLEEANVKNGLSIETCVKLIQFIRANLVPLPYNEAFISIADKLENAVVRSLTRSEYLSKDEVIRELGTSYKLFSTGTDNDVDDTEKSILSELDRFCNHNLLAQIWLKGKEKPIRHFCILTIYQISQDRWYLVIKTKGKERNFGLIRVDRIERLEEVCDIKCDEAMRKRLNIAKEQAYDEIVNSFGMGLGGKTRIKIRIQTDKDILDSLLLRLENCLCGEVEEAEDGSLKLTVEIDGISDFLHWVRGYGSSIMILEPQFVRKMQYEETKKLLKAYREV